MFVTISRSAVYIKCKTIWLKIAWKVGCFSRAHTPASKMQEHGKPLNLLVQWQHATAWQIKLHEKSGCFLLHSSVSLFCDVPDKNVKWFFHFRDLHEFFKISFFLPTKCWSPTNSSEENLLDEIALIEFQCTGSRSRRQPGNTSKYSDGFFICKTKNSTRANTLNFLLHCPCRHFRTAQWVWTLAPASTNFPLSFSSDTRSL